VDRLQFGIAVFGGKFVRALEGFLRFYREFVPTDSHGLLQYVIRKSLIL
jgi:hypothetical protein